MKLSELAALLRCELDGNGDVEILGVASLEDAAPGTITFAASAKRAAALAASPVAAVILAPGVSSAGKPALRTPLPQLAFARALRALQAAPGGAPGIHPTAVVASDARIDPSAGVGPFVVVEAGAAVGPGTQVRAFTLVGEGVVIGRDCVIGSHVVLQARARVGDRVILHDGVVIGTDGFGYTPDERGLPEKIPQVGTVVIEDDVEIGALSTIDRSTTGTTRIGRGVKIDNLCMVAHNCEVGDYTIIAAQSGLSGSTRVGRGVLMGGQVGIPGHLTIGDGARIAAGAAPHGDVPAGTTVAGRPAFAIAPWRRAVALFERLPELVRRIRRLERAAGIDRQDKER
ncbi:MAG: UDP-3-O-(3-hydroxymyristoyl)glucosamine N-acyltransferase [Deltaproteobacteria bacterium RBG_13_65_10]|nr:MAG: UDP-3-O-(3-hydroxymyristoyl)glucosamine N-acyltransferase [Deltaproteobacteria bacterium RBG_13_65_10]